MKRILTVLAFLLLSSPAAAHPGVGGCKAGTLGDVTYSTDCAVQLNVNSVGAAEIADFVDGEVFNLGNIIPDSTADDGLLLPGHPSTCFGASHEGQVCWNRGSDVLSIGTGTAAKVIGENVANVGNCNGPDCLTGTATTEGSVLFFGLTANVATQGNLRFPSDGKMCWLFSPEVCFYIVASGGQQFAFENGFLYNTALEPKLIFDDVSPAGGSEGSPEAIINADATVQDNGNLQLMVESGAPGYVGLVSLLTTGGASTVYLGATSVGGFNTPPTNAITISESGKMDTKGSAEIRDASPHCVELMAAEVGCTAPSFGCAAWQVGSTIQTANFDGTTDETGTWTFRVPEGWDLTTTDPTLTVTINGYGDNAACSAGVDSTRDICFTFDTGSIANNEPVLSPTLDGADNFATAPCQGNGDLTVLQRIGVVHGMQDGELGIFTMVRNAIDISGPCTGLDSYEGFDFKVISVTLCRDNL